MKIKSFRQVGGKWENDQDEFWQVGDKSEEFFARDEEDQFVGPELMWCKKKAEIG